MTYSHDETQKEIHVLVKLHTITIITNNDPLPPNYALMKTLSLALLKKQKKYLT